MATHSSSFYPRLARSTSPSFEINEDADDVMAGSDFEANQQSIHRSTASTSLTTAHQEHSASLHASNVASSTPLSTAKAAKCLSSAHSLHDTASPRCNGHPAEAFSETFPAMLSSASPSRHTSRSPSSPLSAGSGDEDEDEYLPGDSEDEDEGANGTQRGMKSIQRSPPTASASTSRIRRTLWTDAEDAFLRDSVKQHGTRWKRVAKSFDQLNTGTTRSPTSLKQRWTVLLKGDRTLVPPSPRQTTPWTQAETTVLQRSLRVHQQPDGSHLHTKIYEDFLRAFPHSNRSSNSIEGKWRGLLRKQCAEQGSDVGHQRPSVSSLAASRAPASSSTSPNSPMPATSSRPVARSQGCERVSMQTAPMESPIDCDDRAPSLTLRSEGPSISPPATASNEGNASTSRRRMQPQPQRQPQQQTNRQRQPKTYQAAAQPLDVNVLIEQKSVCIEICSPDFHIAIYSETLIKVTREAPPPSVIAFGTSYEAAFLFYVRANGAIRALRLPEDTTTDVTPVPASESCDGGTFIDTVFTGPDDYVVLFRSRL